MYIYCPHFYLAVNQCLLLAILRSFPVFELCQEFGRENTHRWKAQVRLHEKGRMCCADRRGKKLHTYHANVTRPCRSTHSLSMRKQFQSTCVWQSFGGWGGSGVEGAVDRERKRERDGLRSWEFTYTPAGVCSVCVLSTPTTLCLLPKLWFFFLCAYFIQCSFSSYFVLFSHVPFSCPFLVLANQLPRSLVWCAGVPCCLIMFYFVPRFFSFFSLCQATSRHIARFLVVVRLFRVFLSILILLCLSWKKYHFEYILQ